MAAPSLKDFAKAVPYPVQKKLLSILDGFHQGDRAGHSHEFLDLEDYRPGDPVSDIDWRATARFAEPIVKRFEATAVLTVLLAVDAGSGMAALAPGTRSTPGPRLTHANTSTRRTATEPVEKVKLAGEVERSIAWLVAMHGDHLGLVAGNAREMKTLPARVGLGHSETLLRIAGAVSPTAPPSNFAAVLHRVAADAKARSLLLGITDETQITPDVVQRLGRLAHRNSVGLFLIEDFDPTTAARGVEVEDVTSGALPDFVKTAPAVKAQWESYLLGRRRNVDRMLSTVPVSYARVGSSEDVLPALVKVLEGVGRGPRTA